MTSSHSPSCHGHVLSGPRISILSPTFFECSHRPTSPRSYLLIQNFIRPSLSMPSSGVKGRSTWMSSSLMYIDQIGWNAVSLREGMDCRGTVSVIRRVFGSGHGSVSVISTGVKCVGESNEFFLVGAALD